MKKSGGSWIVKKQNSIPGMVIFLQMVILSLFAGSQSIAAQDKQAVTFPLRDTTQVCGDLIEGVRRARG